ncbi:MAG: hypothetical protein LBV49_06340 [Azonexus sp.]|jgi:Tfp pilus assembly protein PilF|nr:hypothetical protein [Azonexus sp.]
MSLLMDALKRAEASKQEAARQQAGREANKETGKETDKETPAAVADGGLSLEPLARDVAVAANPLPDLAEHLAAVDAELADSAQNPAPPAAEGGRLKTPPPPPPQARSQSASPEPMARSSFATRPEPAANNHNRLWLGLGALLLVAGGIGGYVWYQVNSLNRGQLAARPQPMPTPAPAANNSGATPPLPSVQPLPPLAAGTSAAPPREVTKVTPDATPDAPPSLAPRRISPDSPPPPRPRLEAAAGASAAPPIRLTPTPTRPDADLVEAHSRLQAGDLDGASQSFLKALRRDPQQTDALLALAAIAQYQGRLNEAENWRQRALAADPTNPAAQAAALASRAAQGDAQTAESRLKTLLAARPQAAELNFALGNLYARQQRWAEAQSCYFNAVAADSGNPDYLFNLAVSLDQLRQPRLAARHYRLALEAAAGRLPAFDPEAARRRLADLAE